MGGNTRRVLFCGDYESFLSLSNEINSNPSQGMKIVAWLSFEKEKNKYSIKNLDIFSDKNSFQKWMKKNKPDLIILSNFKNCTCKQLLLHTIGDTTIPIFYLPDITLTAAKLKLKMQAGNIGELSLLKLYGRDDNFFGRFLKRIFDIFSSIFLIIIFSPLIMLVSILIKLSSKGPIIFKQRRYGIDCKPFTIYKFRTMNVIENEGEIIQATKNDYRVTKFGSFLRKFSIDELPQLFNVFEGTMSLVGPRPHAIQHNEYYRNIIEGYTQRHSFKPGMTGLAQINGFRGETREIAQMERRIKDDLRYINEWNFFMDINILFKTIFKISSENAF